MKNGRTIVDLSHRSGFDGICLERWRKIRHRIRKTKPKVTIAIGLISRHKGRPPHMIFASDSQTTYGAAKSLDAQKISIVDFADAQVLVAQAGLADLADAAIEIIRKKAKDVPLENEETVSKTVQESVRELRNHFIELNKGCNFTEDGWKSFFRDENTFTLLFGYYFERKPFLYTIDPDWCRPIPIKHPYKAIGIGRDYAEILLREYVQIDPGFEYAQIIATAVVEKTIDNVDGCGRPTWMGVVFPTEEDVLREYTKQKEAWKAVGKNPDRPFYESEAALLNQDSISWVIESLKLEEIKFRTQQKEMILAVLKKVEERREKWAKEIREQYSAGAYSERMRQKD
jgi:20S proteasome alpha/beta subunit